MQLAERLVSLWNEPDISRYSDDPNQGMLFDLHDHESPATPIATPKPTTGDQQHPVDKWLPVYTNYIKAVAKRRGVHQQNIDDVIQDVSAKALRSRHTYQGAPDDEMHFKGWVSKIAHNAISDLYAAHLKRKDDVSYNDKTHQMPTRSPVATPDVHLQPAIDALQSEGQRNVMKLKSQGVANKDIATQLNMTPDNVRKLNERGLISLKQHFAKTQPKRYEQDGLTERFAAMWSAASIERYAMPGAIHPTGTPCKLIANHDNPGTGAFFPKGQSMMYHGDHDAKTAIVSHIGQPKIKHLVPKHLIGS